MNINYSQKTHQVNFAGNSLVILVHHSHVGQHQQMEFDCKDVVQHHGNGLTGAFAGFG